MYIYHNMFSSKYNPEWQKHGIESSLSNIIE